MDRLLSRDDLVRREYAKISETVEEIVEDPDFAEQFLQRVNRKLPAELRFTLKDLNHRLFTLRKRGEDNGGLVRKQRGYYGPNNKPR